MGLSAVVLAGVVIVKLTGSGVFVLGAYVSTTNGSLVPPGAIAAGLVQLDSTMVAIGVVPLTLTGVWTVEPWFAPRIRVATHSRSWCSSLSSVARWWADRSHSGT